MAFIVPFIPYIVAGLSAAGTVYAGVEQKKAANAESADLQRQAKSEELSGAQRQIDRRRNLLRALSSQNAAAGAAGIQLDGSVNAAAKADIRDSNNDLLIDKSNTSDNIRSLRSRASNTRRVGNAQFGASVLGAANGFYNDTKKK